MVRQHAYLSRRQMPPVKRPHERRLHTDTRPSVFPILQVEDAQEYVTQQVADAQAQLEESRAHAQESLEAYQKVGAEKPLQPTAQNPSAKC